MSGTDDRPRVRDGCSMFPDGFWRDCCDAHDDVYEVGGTYLERLRADRELSRCVRARSRARGLRESDDWRERIMVRSGPVGPLVMLVGVQLFGASVWPTSFRWGFGRDYPVTSWLKRLRSGTGE